jgi:hypothetical protein
VRTIWLDFIALGRIAVAIKSAGRTSVLIRSVLIILVDALMLLLGSSAMGIIVHNIQTVGLISVQGQPIHVKNNQ